MVLALPSRLSQNTKYLPKILCSSHCLIHLWNNSTASSKNIFQLLVSCRKSVKTFKKVRYNKVTWTLNKAITSSQVILSSSLTKKKSTWPKWKVRKYQKLKGISVRSLQTKISKIDVFHTRKVVLSPCYQLFNKVITRQRTSKTTFQSFRALMTEPEVLPSSTLG